MVVRKMRSGPSSVFLAAFSVFAIAFSLCMLVSPLRAFAASSDIIVEDEVQRGGIKVRKLLPLDGGATTQGDTKVGGTQFTIELAQGNDVYVGSRWYSVGDIITTITSGDDGWASTPNNYLPYGTYTIREKQINEGQDWATVGNGDRWSKTVAVHTDNLVVNAESVTNPMWRGTISVVKRDSQTGAKSQGEATFAGTVFKVYNRSKSPIIYRRADGSTVRVAVDAAIPDAMIADENGYAALPDNSLEYGTYEVIEDTVARDSANRDMYLPQNPKWSSGRIEIHTRGMHADGGICVNDVVRGTLHLVKYDAERIAANSTPSNSPQGDGFLNAEFEVISRNDRPVVVDGDTYYKGEVCYVLRADKETGVWSSPEKAFPYGTYEVREANPATGYHVDSGWSYTFSVRANGQVYSPSVSESNKNLVKRGGVRVIKVDANSSSTTPQGDADFDGIEITVRNASAHSVLYEGREIMPGDVVCVITMSDGVANTGTNALPYGRYSLRETNVPASTGYRLNPLWNPTVVVSEEGTWANLLL